MSIAAPTRTPVPPNNINRYFIDEFGTQAADTVEECVENADMVRVWHVDPCCVAVKL